MKHVTLAALSCLLSGRVAFAQAQIVPTDVAAAEKAEPQGWNPFLSLTATLRSRAETT
jgi:hypothetical protein